VDKSTKIIEQLGIDIVKDAKKNIKSRKKDKKSSGKLRKSLKSSVKVTPQGDKLTIVAEDYALFVDQGTDDSKGNFFLTDAVDKNIKEYGDKIADAIGEDILARINIILE
jgi:hypothetical protein